MTKALIRLHGWAAQAGLRLCCLQTRRTGFLVSRLYYIWTSTQDFGMYHINYLNKHAQLHSEAVCPNFAHMGEVFKIIPEFRISIESQPQNTDLGSLIHCLVLLNQENRLTRM